MSYCVNCGVKLPDDDKECPLCGTTVINPSDDKKKNPEQKPYPEFIPVQKQKVSKNSIVSLVTLIFILPDLLCIISDFSVSGGISWSGYVITSLLFVYLLFVIPFLLGDRPLICPMLICFDVLLFLFYLEYKTGGNWFFTFALPLTLVFTFFVMILLYISEKRKVSGVITAAVAMFLSAAASVAVEWLINLTFGVHDRITWSFYPLVTFVIIGAALIIIEINKPLKEKLRKKFFI